MATSLTVAIAFDAGNLMLVSKAMRERFPGRPIIVCRDDDWKTKRPNGESWNPGKERAENAATVVGGQVVGPNFACEREDKWTDFNDLHCAEGLDAVRRQVLAVVKPSVAGGWNDLLARSESGLLIAHMQNVELILSNDERWAGVIGFSSFSSKIVKLRVPPYEAERLTLLEVVDTLRIAADTFSAFRTGKKLEKDARGQRDKVIAITTLLEHTKQDKAA